jgi:YVTN family beta-propeller protein
MLARSWRFVLPAISLIMASGIAGVWFFQKRAVLALKPDDSKQDLLPTGKRITPFATRGAHLETLNPNLPKFPNYLAGQAMSTALDPTGKTLLILTSGFNRVKDDKNQNIADASNEYVFVYDMSAALPRKKQVLQVPNTFAGIAFAPDGQRFYVPGGQDDNLHFYKKNGEGVWSQDGEAVKLGHTMGGLGLVPKKDGLASAGVAVTGDGKFGAVANLYNDSLTIVDLGKRTVMAEVDLRPGKSDPMKVGVAGGEYPFWVAAKGTDTVYVSSLRDREVVEVKLGDGAKVTWRIAMRGNPNKMVLNRNQTRLFVAADNSDTVSVVDTTSRKILEEIPTAGPDWLFKNVKRYTGSAPNDLALSQDEKTLYVTNGGSNSVAVIQLGEHSEVVGLIPTGWSPNSVSVGSDNRHLYVVDGKSVPGPNPGLHLGTKASETKPGMAVQLTGQNQYVYQLEKADFLTLPVPGNEELEHLTRMVGANNDYEMQPNVRDEKMMAELRKRIKHVIYIIKENRTYDQILGDLPRGNGDKSLAEFGAPITPNFHRIATDFVDLDNFYNSGEVSGDGWPWSTSGRESDFGVKANAVNYAGRGLQYEFEGTNRDINVGLATLKERKEANAATPDDPDLLPGTANVAEPDGPQGSVQGKGYIWDAVLRKGLTFREYGAMSDVAAAAPREAYPFRAKVKMQRPANPELYQFGDHYYRGFDPGYPDFYREAEWEREFAEFEANGKLPSFELLQLCTDHMGDFKDAISGVNTPERQQADNDYAVGRVIERLAKSRYAADTLVFVIEDDAQDGPDHVDAHRSTAYVVGPYVKQRAVVSNYYTTVSMLRTMEDVLGLEHLNLNTATTRPMTDVFDLKQKTWSFQARPSAALADTQLPLSAEARRMALAGPPVKIAHPAKYWAEKTKEFDFSEEDKIDAVAFNRIVWEGLMKTPYPVR